MESCCRVRLRRLIRADGTTPAATVIIPPALSSEIGYDTESKLTFGLKTIDVRLLPGRKDDIVKLSSDIFRTMGFYDDMQICAKLENGYLKLGPLMGVFMNELAVRRLINNRATVKMTEMQKSAENSHVIVCFFTVDDIIWSDNSVNAVVYMPESNLWEKRILPLPDILYDRGGGFTPESREKAIDLRRGLENIGKLKKINAQHYFDKWDLHCKLSKHSEMESYLPETVAFGNSARQLEWMLNKHKTVYLKMCTGSNGKGVIRVKKLAPPFFEYSYFKHSEKKIVEGIAKTPDEMLRIANTLMDGKSFIIQQGIDVVTYQNNKVDLRVLVQRDSNGKWQITSMPVRFAVNNCAITSTKSGSKVYPFEDALCNILGFDSTRTSIIKSDIHRLIFTAVETIEKEYGIFGELGIDVAIDNKDKLWFIESNAKPAKDTILIAGPEEDIERSFQLPFEYCKYLTGFQ